VHGALLKLTVEDFGKLAGMEHQYECREIRVEVYASDYPLTDPADDDVSAEANTNSANTTTSFIRAFAFVSPRQFETKNERLAPSDRYLGLIRKGARDMELVIMCCRVLQCVAVCCNVLQYVAVCCSVLQCAAVCCSVLQCAAMCCSVCIAVCCRVLQCVAVCCSVLQCMLQCVAVYCSGVLQYSNTAVVGGLAPSDRDPNFTRKRARDMKLARFLKSQRLPCLYVVYSVGHLLLSFLTYKRARDMEQDSSAEGDLKHKASYACSPPCTIRYSAYISQVHYRVAKTHRMP